MTHRYYLCNRPPMYGTMEPGWTTRQSYDSVMKPPELDREQVYHGWVEYTEKLTFKTIWKWEYHPGDSLEYAQYRLWLLADRDQAMADEMVQDYSRLSKEELTADAAYNPWSEAVLQLLEAQNDN